MKVTPHPYHMHLPCYGVFDLRHFVFIAPVVDRLAVVTLLKRRSNNTSIMFLNDTYTSSYLFCPKRDFFVS